MLAIHSIVGTLWAVMATIGMASSVAADRVAITIDDFRLIEGETWSGDLNYLDYQSGKRTSIPVRAQFEVSDETSLLYAIQYPGEEQHNNKTSMKLSDNGKTFDGKPVVSRTATGSTITIITESRGRDDNQDADIQIVYEISSDLFRMKKNVRLDGGEAYFNRNVYTFKR